MSHTPKLDFEARGALNLRVTLIGALVNLCLVLIKFSVGILGHSQALVADAVHSLSDLLNDFGLILAMHYSRQAPDAEHPYGHERFETIAALAIGVMLAINGAWISIHSAQRLYSGVLLMPESYTLIAAAIGIVAKEGLYQYTMRVARITQSAALRANAWDHRSDAISSVIVFLGIGGSLMGFPYLDAAVAILVGFIVLRLGYKTAWDALQELVDRGLGQDDIDKIQTLIKNTEGVQGLHLLKTRRMGHQALAEAHIQVAPYLSVSEGHQIAERVRRVLRDQVADLSEATIHIDSEDDQEENQVLPTRAEIEAKLAAALQGAQLPLPQNMTLHYLANQIELDLCYAVDETADLPALKSVEQRIRQCLNEARIAQTVQVRWQHKRC